MKKQTSYQNYVVLEPAVFCGRLSGRFFRFCLLRSPSLLAFLPLQIWAAILGLFPFSPKISAYRASCEWRFLKAVPDLLSKASAFAKGKNRFSLPSDCDVLVYDGPKDLLSLWFKEVHILANPFDGKTGRFTAYATVNELLAKENEIPSLTAGLGNFPSAARRNYAVFGRVFPSAKKAYLFGIRKAVLRGLLLALLGVLLGVTSLYFARDGLFDLSMFRSYFTTGNLALLNLVPPVLLMFLLYAVFNRVYAAFAGTFILTLIPTWISYFKRLYRNDPFYFEDIVLVREARTMTGAYAIVLTAGIWHTIAAAVLLCILLFFVAKPRYKRLSVRVVSFALTGIICMGLLQNVYLSDEVYAANKNEAQINRWSPTEQFVSRGFVYPFLYSIKDVAGSTKPYDYDQAAVSALAEAYPDKDIPADEKVNFIFIMLESFNDFSRFTESPFRKNPYAPWDALAKQGLSGRLVVNMFGGGTVDTERRVMSGLFRQPGYKKETNTYVQYFAKQGYKTFGGHPNNGWFYKRAKASKNIGFADYAFAENYFSDFANAKQDSVFFPEILRLYEQNKSDTAPCFGFFVTYQGHGPYNPEAIFEDPYLIQGDIPAEEYTLMEDYFQQMADTCRQVALLTDELQKQDEPVVLVVFGDHNPFLGKNGFDHLQISMDTATEEGFYNYYSTPYIIWGNHAAKSVLKNDLMGQGPVISPEFLIPTLFKTLGWEGSSLIQANGALAERLPVIHKTGRFLENGVLTDTPLPDHYAFYRSIISYQYDWQSIKK